MDLFSYASRHVSRQTDAASISMHYREKYHRGAPDSPDEIGAHRGSALDTFPFPGASVGDNLKNETTPDPAKNYPTKASIKAAFDQWTAEGQPWPPPAGLTSAIASRLIPRRPKEHRTWRK